MVGPVLRYLLPLLFHVQNKEYRRRKEDASHGMVPLCGQDDVYDHYFENYPQRHNISVAVNCYKSTQTGRRWEKETVSNLFDYVQCPEIHFELSIREL